MRVRNGFLDLTRETAWRDEFAEVFVSQACTGVLLSSPLIEAAALPGLRGVGFLRGVKDVSWVAGIAGLRELNLPTDYTGQLDLSGLTELEALSMPFTAAVRGLTALTRLRDVMIHDWPKGVGMDILGANPELEFLRLEFKGRAKNSSAVLAQAPKLRRLSLYDGALTDTTGLSGLAEMRELYLYGTKIESIDFVAGMPKLSTLWLEKCGKIADVEALRGHPSLRIVVLSSTKVASGDLSPTQELPSAKEVVVFRATAGRK